MSSEKGRSFVGPGVMIAALAAVGIFGGRFSLEGARPEGSTRRSVGLYGAQRVPARLWEDPLGAVRRSAAGEKEGDGKSLGVIDLVEPMKGAELSAFQEMLLLDKDWLVLSVFVKDGYYENDAEDRRRTRYAVQAALNMDGYEPVDGEHLGAFRFLNAEHRRSLGSESCKDLQHGARHLFPFELFERTEREGVDVQHPGHADSAKSHAQAGGKKNVMVLWIPDAELGEDVLCSLHSLLESLACRSRVASNSGAPAFAYIGPVNSAALVKLVAEDVELDHVASKHGGAEPDRNGEANLADRGALSPGKVGSTKSARSMLHCASLKWCPFNNATLISAWATAPSTKLAALREAYEAQDAGVVGEATDVSVGGRIEPATTTTRRALRLNCGLRIVRGIGTDDVLVRLLVDELRLRGVDTARDDIAILGEFGSTYSSQFLTQFSSSAGEGQNEGDGVRCGETSEEAGQKQRDNIHLHAYALGLDGAIPGEDPMGTTARERGSSGEVLESTSGRSQVDYIRRLQEGLREIEYRAIGIVGVDIFDKLLLIRALRQEFPSAILFTTDVDARFLEKSEYESVRNLIIASHFGLRPVIHGGSGPQPLPFRDTYQTAHFFAAHDLLEAPSQFALTRIVSDLPQSGDNGHIGNAGDEERILVKFAETITARFLASLSRSNTNGKSDESHESSDLLVTPGRTVLHEVGRTGLVELPIDGENDPQHLPVWFLFSFALSGVFTIFIQLRIGRVLNVLRSAGREDGLRWINLWRAGHFTLWLLSSLGLAGVIVSGLDYWSCSAGEDVSRGAALGMILLLLLLGWFGLNAGSDEKRDRKLMARVATHALPISGMAIVILGLAVMTDLEGGGGEPLLLAEGVNVWPTIGLRLLVIVTSVVTMIQMEKFMRSSDDKVFKAFVRPEGSDDDGKAKSFSWPTLDEIFMAPRSKNSSGALGLAWEWYIACRKARLLRTAIMTVLFATLMWLAGKVEGSEFGHARGDIAMGFERWSRGLSLISVAGLMFYVADATQLCRRLISPFHRREVTSYWSKESGAPDAHEGNPAGHQVHAQSREVRLANLQPLRVIRFVAELTHNVSRLSWYPFALLFVLILARTTYIENWAWSWSSAALFLLCISGVFVTALFLRKSAEKLRLKLVAELREQVLRHKLRDDVGAIDEMELALSELKDTRRGAFQPLSENPIVAAALLPFGGVGTLALLEMLNS